MAESWFLRVERWLGTVDMRLPVVTGKHERSRCPSTMCAVGRALGRCCSRGCTCLRKSGLMRCERSRHLAACRWHDMRFARERPLNPRGYPSLRCVLLLVQTISSTPELHAFNAFNDVLFTYNGVKKTRQRSAARDERSGLVSRRVFPLADVLKAVAGDSSKWFGGLIEGLAHSTRRRETYTKFLCAMGRFSCMVVYLRVVHGWARDVGWTTVSGGDIGSHLSDRFYRAAPNLSIGSLTQKKFHIHHLQALFTTSPYHTSRHEQTTC